MHKDELNRALSGIHPLSREFQEALKNELTIGSFRRNQFLLKAGETAFHAWFLETGCALSYYYAEGRKMATAFWQPGDIIISPKCFFEQQPSIEFIQVTQQSVIHELSIVSANTLLDQYPVSHVLVRTIVAGYYERAATRAMDFQHLSAWVRYGKLLATYPKLEQKVSQEIIASYLGITPQSLSRLKLKHSHA